MAIVQSPSNGAMHGAAHGWGLGEEVRISSRLRQRLGGQYEAGAARLQAAGDGTPRHQPRRRPRWTGWVVHVRPMSEGENTLHGASHSWLCCGVALLWCILEHSVYLYSALSPFPLAAVDPLPFSAMMVLKMASSLGITTSAFW